MCLGIHLSSGYSSVYEHDNIYIIHFSSSTKIKIQYADATEGQTKMKLMGKAVSPWGQELYRQRRRREK